MQLKYPLRLSLALAVGFATAPVLAHAAPQDGAPPPPPGQQGPQQPAPPPGLRTQPPPPPWQAATERDAQRTIPGVYRLTYTLTEMDGSRRVGSQHYDVLLDADAPPTNLKLGTKVPLVTGGVESNNLMTQIQYIDVGLNINARLRQFANGLELRSHVEQSTLDPGQANQKDPVIRQTSLESTVLLNQNKPMVLGNLDTPGSTHSMQIQVELTRVP